MTLSQDGENPEVVELQSAGHRLDVAVTLRGLSASRSVARRLIDSGDVSVNGLTSIKPSLIVSITDTIAIAQSSEQFVSRGGIKLAAAIDQFGIEVEGKVCLDIGASTGGFTQCLLRRGAASVVALDVGHSQMDPSLALDPRVDLREGVNARNLTAKMFCAPFDLVTVDVSFISLRYILPEILQLVAKTAIVICLIKPQYEVGRAGVSKRGIVSDEHMRKRAVADVIECAAALGLTCLETMESPIVGGDGNREYLAAFAAAAAGT